MATQRKTAGRGAPKGNKNALGNQGGRPTKYNGESHPRIARAMASAGCSDATIARALGVATSTLHLWRSTHIEFSDALSQGKDVVDAALQRTAIQRALGYDYETEKVFQNGTKIIVTEHVPPSEAMLKFLLANRMPHEFNQRRAEERDVGRCYLAALEAMNERAMLKRAERARVINEAGPGNAIADQ